MGGNEMYRESHLYHEGYTDGHRDGWKDAKRAAEEKARKPPAPVDEAAVEALARGIEPGVGAVVREKSKGGWAWTRESDGRWRSYGSDGTKRGDSTFDKITANTSVTLVPPPTPDAPPAPAPGEVVIQRDRLADAIVYHGHQASQGGCPSRCDVLLGTSLAEHAIDVALSDIDDVTAAWHASRASR